MKNYVYIIIVLFCNIIAAQAQRMLPKQKGLEISTGVIADGKIGTDYYITAGMTINGKKGNYQLWAVEYSSKKYGYKQIQIPVETFTAEVGYSFLLISDSGKNSSLNFGLNGIAGYESINRGKELLSDGAKLLTQDNFIYGAGGRLTIETYLSDRIILLLQAGTKVLWGTDLQQIRPSVGIGLRFNF